ncbi:MAG: GNAT family N-acetyltransferase [Ilumatobacter sp.]|uniref:GNAT family N-acetyltransferase n=1 Tax=Ilumatobacter sp. TaxID=1967498 RepID=UPI003C75B423
MLTERLEVRTPVEGDRDRFVELFGDPEFMVFSGGVLDAAGANERFDHMQELAVELPYAKRPIVERATGSILGYTGVDRFEFEGSTRLEFGWRLIPSARGVGYATEAARAVLAVLEREFTGTVLAMIDPENDPSKSVARRLGFEFWKLATVGGYLDEIHRREVG